MRRGNRPIGRFRPLTLPTIPIGPDERYIQIYNKIKNMINKIQEVYERIFNEFLSMGPFGPFNSKDYRIEFKQRLENEIINSTIKCDEENNPPEVIDSCCLIARVSWVEDYQQRYCNLIFGQPEQVRKLQQQYL